MLLIILIGAMLNHVQPELHPLSAPYNSFAAGPEVWRWRCINGVA